MPIQIPNQEDKPYEKLDIQNNEMENNDKNTMEIPDNLQVL